MHIKQFIVKHQAMVLDALMQRLPLDIDFLIEWKNDGNTESSRALPKIETLHLIKEAIEKRTLYEFLTATRNKVVIETLVRFWLPSSTV